MSAAFLVGCIIRGVFGWSLGREIREEGGERYTGESWVRSPTRRDVSDTDSERIGTCELGVVIA